MFLATMLYLLNGFLYSIMVYCVLLMLEKSGKRKQVTKAKRGDLAARWAVGFTLLQICTDTIRYIL